MKLRLTFSILLSFISFASGNNAIRKGKNVLIIGPLDTGTHMLSMSPFAVALAEAGYNVSIFEWNYKKEARNLGPLVKNYHIHEKSLDAKILEKRAINTFVGDYSGFEYIELLPKFNKVTRIFVEEHSDLFRSILSVKWNLIVIDELFTFHGLAIAAFLRKYYNVPYAIYSTTQMMAHTSSNLGLSRNLIMRPYIMTRLAEDEHDLYDVKKFLHRLVNFKDAAAELMGNILLSKRYFGSNSYLLGIDDFEFEKFYQGASLTIADYYTRWKYPIPENSRMKSMASACKKVGTLPADLKQFLEDPRSQGTIYMAFGTAIFWEFAPTWMLDAFFGAFEQLNDYRVIFAYNGAPRNVSNHVKLLSWAPQLEILSHPKTKVYVSHGGLKSSKEAACAAVPVVYFPLYAEQTFNCHMATVMGFALPLSKHTITAHQLERTIRRVATESQFKENIIKARSLALDRPMNAVDEMIFYVDRIFKSRNAEFDFRNKSGHVSYFEYLYGELVLLTSLLLFILASE